MLHWKISEFFFTNHSTRILPMYFSACQYFDIQSDRKKILKLRVCRRTNQACMQPSRYLLVQNQQWKHQTMYGIFSKLTINTPEWSHWRRSGIFVLNFQQISHFAFMFSLFTSTNKCWDGKQPLQSSSKILNNHSLIWLNVHCTKNEVFH